MNMTSEQIQARVPVAILRLQGDVDGSNFQQAIDRARELYQAGARYLLVDLTGVPYMSSSGLVALHNMALLFRGSTPPDPQEGWRAIRAMGDASAEGFQQHVKLLNPQPRVARILDQAGLTDFFEIHTDQAAAVESF